MHFLSDQLNTDNFEKTKNKDIINFWLTIKIEKDNLEETVDTFEKLCGFKSQKSSKFQ